MNLEMKQRRWKWWTCTDHQKRMDDQDKKLADSTGRQKRA